MGMPTQISSKAAVAALRVLQTKVKEAQLDRDRDAARYADDLRRAHDDLQRSRASHDADVQRLTTHNRSALDELDRSVKEADGLRLELADCKRQVKDLKARLHASTQAAEALSQNLDESRAELSNVSRPKQSYTTGTQTDPEPDSSDVHYSPPPALSRRAYMAPSPTPVPIAYVPIASATPLPISSVTSATRFADAKDRDRDDEEIVRLLRGTQADDACQLLKARCDRLEQLLMMYSKSVLKQRCRKTKTRQPHASLPARHALLPDRVSRLESSVRKLTVRSAKLIDQLDQGTSQSVHERLLEILQQLDDAQSELAHLRSQRQRVTR
ncbi:unnamed protein product (mitochondrion) [Plasmodiophora brassicae]|nr:unnamed protein product [Plasmodiophora brassicae]